MRAISKSLERLEGMAKKPEQADILEGLDIFQSIPEQIDIETIRPSTLHRMIRRAQDMRIVSLDDIETSRLLDDTVTLTIPEGNFVYVHERDVRAGTLRQTASETFQHIDRLLAKDEEVTQPVDETVTSESLADLIEDANQLVAKRAKELR